MADRTQKALSDFVSEAQETIDALGKALMDLEHPGADPDPDLLNGAFRHAHTLKGLSAMFGVERMARLAHALEDLLDDVRMGRRPLDRGAVDLLLEAPEIFSRIIAEEAEGGGAASAEAAQRLTDRLRATESAQPAAADDPLDAVALGPEVRQVLTEYEEHRLRANVVKGRSLYRVRASFDLASFDQDLGSLNARLKRVGEVISTLPASDVPDPATIGFELLFASTEPAGTVSGEAGPQAVVEPVARLRPVHGEPPAPPARAASRTSPPPAPPPPAGPTAPVLAAPAPPASPAAAPAALSPVPEAAPEADTPSLRSASQAVRVDIKKLDLLMNAVGELVLVKSSLFAIAERLKAEGGDPAMAAEFHRVNRTLDRKLAELQDGIIEVRMVPLEQIFDKLTRMVRKLAREVGKEVELEVRGGDVELDKLIVEDLSDPLMHLIRNGIDHAIEPPDVRARLGKPRTGRITLSAVQRGNHVRITVEDDGAGIDIDRIRDAAVSRGLATAEAAGAMTRREILNLIFVPGFSTARQVTALSGRGVGMDVVKNNIAALSGIIDLQTERGRGTRFELTLPVTLAIIRALVVSVAGRTYALPLNSVLEILEVRAADLRTLSTREVITLRGATLPVVRLTRFFGLPSEAAVDPFFVVVVGLAQERLGVAVDDLLGQQDIVVKPLGRLLQGVRGVSGATDLGDRRSVLVLDVGAVIEDVVRGEGAREAAG